MKKRHPFTSDSRGKGVHLETGHPDPAAVSPSLQPRRDHPLALPRPLAVSTEVGFICDHRGLMETSLPPPSGVGLSEVGAVPSVSVRSHTVLSGGCAFPSCPLLCPGSLNLASSALAHRTWAVGRASALGRPMCLLFLNRRSSEVVAH